jgi:hypothetical protein
MITKCHVLRLAAIAVFAIAIPQFASARDAGHDAAMKLAMGPISAAQMNQNQGLAEII